MKIVWYTRGSVRGTRLIYIISHQERFLWKNARYQIAGMTLYLEDMVLLVQERDKERCNKTELALLQYVEHLAGRKRPRSD